MRCPFARSENEAAQLVANSSNFFHVDTHSMQCGVGRYSDCMGGLGVRNGTDDVVLPHWASLTVMFQMPVKANPEQLAC